MGGTFNPCPYPYCGSVSRSGLEFTIFPSSYKSTCTAWRWFIIHLHNSESASPPAVRHHFNCCPSSGPPGCQSTAVMCREPSMSERTLTCTPPHFFFAFCDCAIPSFLAFLCVIFHSGSQIFPGDQVFVVSGFFGSRKIQKSCFFKKNNLVY